MTSVDQSSSATIHQIDDYRKTRRDLWGWLNQIKAEGDAGALLVAFEIAQHVNRETGEAFPGSDTIAAGINKSQPFVVKMVKRLKAGGHLAIKAGSPGRPGRGHSNRYRPLRKDHKCDASSEGKVSRLEAESITDRTGKDHPGDMNYKSNIEDNQGAPPARAADVETPSDRDFIALCQKYPLAPDVGCRDVFNQIRAAGVDLEDMLDSACFFAEEMRNSTPRPMINFLRYMLEQAVVHE